MPWYNEEKGLHILEKIFFFFVNLLFIINYYKNIAYMFDIYVYYYIYIYYIICLLIFEKLFWSTNELRSN